MILHPTYTDRTVFAYNLASTPVLNASIAYSGLGKMNLVFGLRLDGRVVFDGALHHNATIAGLVNDQRSQNLTVGRLMEEKFSRPSWDEYFMQVAQAISKRASCDRGRSGCVIVSDRQILASGYVGAPPGLPHCDEAGHLFHSVIHDDGVTREHCVRTVHAEQNAICQAAKRGAALDDATLYCRMTPCRTCAMLIISCGISRVVCERRYHAGAESEELLRQAGIRLEFVHDEIQEY